MAKKPDKIVNDDEKLSRFIEQKTSENEALKKLLAELNKENHSEKKNYKKKK